MRILLVEDEKKISDFLRRAFKAEGFVVDVAEDGESGSYLARTNEYDMIVLDNVLPKKEGIVVCAEIRKSGKTVPILILSVRSEATTKVDLLNVGADDYLTKPFSLEELFARMRTLLRRPQHIEEEVLHVDDLVLDTTQHTAYRGKKEIYLTPKEFALLEYLMKNKGAVLSRAMIMEHVWSLDANPFSNTIETHILSLRRKIDTSGVKRKLIRTIPVRGYKIEAA